MKSAAKAHKRSRELILLLFCVFCAFLRQILQGQLTITNVDLTLQLEPNTLHNFAFQERA